jgi:hypothetical protein
VEEAVGDIRRYSEMLSGFGRCKFCCGRSERATTVDVLIPQACNRHVPVTANAVAGVACFQIAKEE